MPNDIIDSLVHVIQKATGLTVGQIKACVYYAATTYRIDDLDFLPMLVALGSPGTGKSTLLRIMKKLCFKAKEVGCDGITVAALRDKLVDTRNGTIIAEEADKAASPNKAESQFRARCDRVTAHLEVKRPVEERGWIQDPRSIYGASVMHQREPFRDQATQSRAIIIQPRFREETFVEGEIDDQAREAVRDLAKNADLKAQPAVLPGTAGRVVDVWRPLLLIAQATKDGDWLEWAWNEMELASGELHDGQGYEPQALILARVVELLSEEPVSGSRRIKPQMQRIKVDTEMVDYLRKHSLPYTNAWQVSRTLKNLGFEVQRIGGVNYLLPTVKSLILAAQKVGYEDSVVRNLSQQQPLGQPQVMQLCKSLGEYIYNSNIIFAYLLNVR